MSEDDARGRDGRFRRPGDVVPQRWDVLAGYLAEQGLRFDTAAGVRQFAGGLANLNYLVEVNGQRAVLRRPPPGPSAEGANDMAREWRVLRGLNAGYPLAPRGLHFCADPDVLGAPFQLLEYRDGHSLGGRLPPVLAGRGDAGPRLTSLVLDAMTRLHALDPVTLGLGDLGRPDTFLERQVEGWARRAAAAYPEGVPGEVDRVVRWLRAALPTVPTAPGSLLHNDLKFDNMLVDVDRDTGALTAVAVIDWDMATRGDPLFDLAVLLSYWVEPADPVELHGLGQVPSLEPGFPRRRDVVAQYFALSGREPAGLGVHLTLARLRLAIAWTQLYRLFQRGAVRDPEYGSFADTAAAMLRWTADTLADPPL